LGIPRVEDLNRPAQPGVGYVTRTIMRGRRMSSAQAFLKPARTRSNLRVITDASVERVLFEGKRAIGVRVASGAAEGDYHGRETVLSAGALVTPKLLMLSGVGPAEELMAAGVDIVHDSPGVGQHLFEHRLLMMRYGLKRPLSQNREFRGWRLVRNALRYQLFGQGPLAAGAYEAGAFARVLPDDDTPDVEVLMAPYIVLRDAKGRMQADTAETFHLFGYPLRSKSEGSLQLSADNPTGPLRIRPNYLSHPYDRAVTVAMYRYIQNWVRQAPLADLITKQIEPGADLRTDDEIISAFLTYGNAGYHASGTCRMGDFADAVCDEETRVRGVDGLRIVDTSLMPAMVSANTNGPVMATAWRASEIILRARNI
jgi:choline dehydrogenase-like flavoprotein